MHADTATHIEKLFNGTVLKGGPGSGPQIGNQNARKYPPAEKPHRYQNLGGIDDDLIDRICKAMARLLSEAASMPYDEAKEQVDAVLDSLTGNKEPKDEPEEMREMPQLEPARQQPG